MYVFSNQKTINKINWYLLFITLSLFLTATSIYSTTVNGSIRALEKNDSNYVYKLSISIEEDSATLGNAVIRYTYNKDHLYFPPNPKEGIDYFFNGYYSNYYLTSVSQPSEGKLSINIVYLSGSGVNILTDLLDVVTLNFKVIAPADDIVLQPELRQFFSPLSSSQWVLGTWEELPLSFELSFFAASLIEGKVRLDWETATEINNYGFEILRTDSSENWQTIGFVPGYGNSYSPKNYSFIDEDTLYGNIRYRLKQLDNSGSFVYSDIAEVFMPATKELDFELSYFTASYLEGMVRLDWETVNEINIYGYDVLRTDSTEDWQTIGFVSGHGTSDSAAIYSFIDADTLYGNIRYRLKQIDSSGSFVYSSITEVFVDTPTGLEDIGENMQYSLNQNYPNPFNPTTIISFTLPETEKINITIYNSIGQKVMDVANGEFEKGIHNVKIDGSSLSSGMYIYRLETAKFSQTRKMMLLK